LRTLSDELEQELGLIMLKKNVIMYADDTALLAESASNLQNTLNLIQEYCIKWKLKVNIDKIKVLIFFQGKFANKHSF
jgi:hemerythrin-like domain-containing protein